MKVEKISSNVLRLSERLNDNQYNVQYSTSEGVTIAKIAIDHAKREFNLILNNDALRYTSTLTAISSFLGVNSIFLKNDNIAITNCYGYKITVKHEKF